ncbi:MAG: HEAT repeat domain-containing protein [Candidatus Binataceae bacterium]
MRTRLFAVVALAFALTAAMAGSGRCDDNTVVIPPGTCMRVAEKYVSNPEKRDRRYIAFFQKCGDRDTLNVLLRGFAASQKTSSSLTLAAAVQAALSAPALKGGAWGAARLNEAFPTIRNADSRVLLVPILGAHNQCATLIGLLMRDSSAPVRKAAAVALAECSPAVDNDLLFRVAHSDRSPEVRAAAWMTLERLGWLRNPDDLLAALNAQSDASAAIQLFDAWIEALPAPVSPAAYAEQLLALARDGTRNQATGALVTIVNVLETGESAGAHEKPLPVDAAALHDALEHRRTEIASAALRRFTGQGGSDRNAAAVDFAAFAAAEGCTSGDCVSATPRILGATDDLPARLAGEASAMFAAVSGSGFVAYRRREYVRVIVIATVIMLIGIGACLWRGGITLATPAIVAFGAFAAGSILQLFATTHAAGAWPPLRLWPATFVGNVTIATMVAALIAFAFEPGRRRTIAAFITAEVSWWILPLVLAATGVSLHTRHYGGGMTTLLAPIAGACAVPFLAWALTGLGGILSQRMLARHRGIGRGLNTTA